MPKMYPKQQRMYRSSEEETRSLKSADAIVEVNELHGEVSTVKDTRAAIAAREEEITARTFELDAKEARLDASQLSGEGPVIAAQWAALAAERQVLAGRWMCLAEDKKALAAMERRVLRDDPEPFEPGSLPIHDVSCAIIAHQVDIPLSSCCFQR